MRFKCKAEEQCQRGEHGKHRRSLPEATNDASGRHEALTQRIDDACADERDDRHHGNHRVRRPDVAHYFRGIQQIVDGHQVQSRIELLEEEVFDRRHEREHEHPHERGRQQRKPHAAHAIHAIRREPQKRGERCEQIEALHDVRQHARAQQRGKCQRAHLLGATECAPQHHAQQQSETHVPEGKGKQRAKAPPPR